MAFFIKIKGTPPFVAPITRFKLTRLGGDLVVCIETTRTARHFLSQSNRINIRKNTIHVKSFFKKIAAKKIAAV